MWQDPSTEAPPFEVRLELDGWDLFWSLLEVVPGADRELAVVRAEVSERARASFELATLSTHPMVSALRALFKAAGCSPSRYRPSSEALLRRLLKGQELSAIHPLVDLTNCLYATLAVPCCVSVEGTVRPPVTLRAGREGESYESLRGPFNLARKPIVVDAEGPFDTPDHRQSAGHGPVRYPPRLVGRLSAARSGLARRGGAGAERSRRPGSGGDGFASVGFKRRGRLSLGWAGRAGGQGLDLHPAPARSGGESMTRQEDAF